VNFIDAIIQNLLAVVEFVSPIRVLRPYQRGVVFRFGHYHRTAGEGVCWLWPCKVEIVEVVGVAEETRNLLTQTVTTADGVAVTFSVNLVFRCVDAALFIIAVHDFEQSLDAYAMTHLARRVREMTWDDLLANQKKLEASLEGTLSTRLKPWGAEILSVGFTDMVRAKPFRFYGDPLGVKG